MVFLYTQKVDSFVTLHWAVDFILINPRKYLRAKIMV